MDQPPIQSFSARPDKIIYPNSARLARMRFLSRLMDNSILLPGGYRIGLDPIIGLIPGIGDVVASALSIWLIWDAACLGLKKRHLLLMVINVLVETLAGTIPLIGDIFDAAWKANAKNMQLVETHFHPTMPPRPLHRIFLSFLLFILLFYAILAAIIYFGVRMLLGLFS